MKLLTLPPLLLVAIAQGTISDLSLSRPIQTETACAQVASFVANSSLQYSSVSAELAMMCLKSVPISQTDAVNTINALKKMVEFHSTLSYLKTPPEGWPNKKVDIMAELDTIASKVRYGNYTSEYDFEEAIAYLFIDAHDGHLNFNGMAWAGAFRFRRSSRITLISASRDGVELPKIWAINDFNTTDTSYQRSPVSNINGVSAGEYLESEAECTSYHDPDARYNAMFFMQPAENLGYFTNPRFFVGYRTNITFENGTAHDYENSAIVLEPRAWRYIYSPASFYETYVQPLTSSERLKPRNPSALPYHLENPRDHQYQSGFAIERGSVPLSYPRPFVSHSAQDVPLAGYFIPTPQGQIGVLVVQTFNTEDVSGARQFQRVVQRYIAEAQERGVSQHIIDVRTNGGGKVPSGYDMYLQFFPSQGPQAQSRYHGNHASVVFGRALSSFSTPTLANGELYTSPFSNDAYLSPKLTKFADWKAMYPPERFHNDSFTTLLKYNLSDPLMTSDSRLAVGIVPTGYGNRANFTQDPFRAEDLIILTDGLCMSTCSIFVELMVQQSNVRTIAVGGRPQTGLMEAVGRTKGTLVLPYQYLLSLSAVVQSTFPVSPSDIESLSSAFGINVQDASVNFQDNIRAGLEKDGIPSQFSNDSASCRIWYEPQHYLNVTTLWEKSAAVAFGGNGGGLNESTCIEGSVSSRDQQTGAGEGNPGTGRGDSSKGDGSGDMENGAAVVQVKRMIMVVWGTMIATML